MPDETAGSPAPDTLGLVHRGWDHLKLQRPLAAWASWQQALRDKPGDPAATQALGRLEVAEVLPRAARATYRFLGPDRDDRRARWDAVFRARSMSDVDQARDAFAGLTEADPGDAPALFNRGLCEAWLGRNVESIRSLAGFVRLSAAGLAEAAIGAWTLAEVLRHGGGAEFLADDLAGSLRLPWPGDRLAVEDLDEPGRVRIHPVSIDPSTGRAADPDVVAYEWLDRPLEAPTPIGSSGELPICLASIVRRPGVLEISTPRPEGRPAIEERLSRRGGAGERPFSWDLTPLPLSFLDAAVWTFRFPPGMADEDRRRLTREAVERYYEEQWLHVPRIGLAEVDESLADRPSPCSPLEAGRRAAAGDPIAAAKLEAVIRVREQLAARPHMADLASGYPFDRLRRRVGLPPSDPSSIDPADLSSAGEAELLGLDAGTLDRAQLAEATRAAASLGLEALAARLAASGVGRDRPKPLSRTEGDET